MTTIVRPSLPVPDSTIRLYPASQYTIEELTNAYNQTRVDYMVPMPMNAARLAAYVKNYDVDMERSWVAMDGSEMHGLAMLGVRPGRTWLTRLGVLPIRRRHGTGEALTHALIEGTRQLGRPLSILEVIKGNTPAHQLFLKVGFQPTRELVILRRPPGPPPPGPNSKPAWLEEEEALDRLCSHPVHPAWTNELESYINAGDAQGIDVSLDNGAKGWLVFRRQKFMLSHFVFHTEAGDPHTIAAALANILYNRFPHIDTYIENLPVDDPHLPALMQMGFIEIFRRIEMYWGSA
jgi:GNAT superfamily N-acetyltransferase